MLAAQAQQHAESGHSETRAAAAMSSPREMRPPSRSSLLLADEPRQLRSASRTDRVGWARCQRRTQQIAERLPNHSRGAFSNAALCGHRRDGTAATLGPHSWCSGMLDARVADRAAHLSFGVMQQWRLALCSAAQMPVAACYGQSANLSHLPWASLPLRRAHRLLPCR